MTHAERMADIKQREQAATAGPWVVEDWGYPDSELMSIVAPPVTCEPPRHEMFADLGNPIIQDEGGECSAANMTFIAHARQDIPYLLSRVKDMEAALGEAIECLYGHAIKSDADFDPDQLQRDYERLTAARDGNAHHAQGDANG